MGDAAPLGGELGVEDDVLAVIGAVELHPDGFELVGGQDFALLDGSVGHELEFGEEHLAEDGGADLLEVEVEVVEPLLAFGVLEHVLEQQVLICRGGDFGAEDGVLGVDEVLLLAAVPAVHGVPHLVGEGRDGLIGIVPAHEHEGMDAVDTPGVSAATLALVLAAVDPAGFESLEEVVLVGAAERCEGFFEDAFGLLIAVGSLGLLDDGHVEVVHVDGVEFQQALLDLHVAVQRRQGRVRRLNRAVVDGERDVVGVEGRLAHGRIVAHGGGELTALDGGAVERGKGVAERTVRRKQLREGILTDILVCTAQEVHVAALGEWRELAVFAKRVRELEVGVDHDGVGVTRGAAQLAGAREEGLLFWRQDVRLHAQELLQAEAVFREARQGIGKAPQRFFRQCEQLRLDEGRRRADLVEQRHDARGICLMLLIGRVGVRHHAGPGEDRRERDLHLVLLGQAVEQCLRVVEPPLE